MAWIITKDHMKTGLIGRGVFDESVQLKDCTKKFVIVNSKGATCYEGVATACEPVERSIVIHAVGHKMKAKVGVRVA
jgi:hypothetical protein